MPKIEIVMANPDVRQVSRPGTTWFLSGCNEEDAARLVNAGNRPDEIEPEICTRAGDATVVKVVHSNGHAHEVSAWRGPTAVHELFRLDNGGRDIVIADHFRNAMARLPTDKRAPSDDAIVDHFLFRATPGHNTYCEKIVRLGHGERCTIELASGKRDTTVYQKLEVDPVTRSVSDYVDDVDRAMDAVLSPWKGRDGVVSLFSGGVDSTLVHSYLGANNAALNLLVDSKESDTTMEAGYAKSAAGLLGVELLRQEVHQSVYLSDLERATENASMPIYMAMLAVFARAYANDHRRYVAGLNADALFGCAAQYNRVASLFANPVLLGCLELAAPLIARKDKARRNVWRERLEKLLPAARRMSAEPDSMLGLGARSETYTDFDVAEEIFGEETIARRLEKRLEYLMERVAPRAPRGQRFYRHLEMYSLMDVICGGYVPQMRHLAVANNKSLEMPFMSGDVVRSALGIPVSDRYIRGFEGKYILKGLLQRRLPAYPIRQRKGTTALVNFPRYFKTGPLSGIWGRYEVPDFIPDGVKDRIVSSPLNVTYSAITFAMWKRRVVENTELEPLSNEQRFAWSY